MTSAFKVEQFVIGVRRRYKSIFDFILIGIFMVELCCCWRTKRSEFIFVAKLTVLNEGNRFFMMTMISTTNYSTLRSHLTTSPLNDSHPTRPDFSNEMQTITEAREFFTELYLPNVMRHSARLINHVCGLSLITIETTVTE